MQAAEPQPAVDDDKLVLNWRRILINTFIVFHLTVTLSWLTGQCLNIWTVGVKSPVRDLYSWIGAKTYPYMMLTGTWQAWSMFAPNPSQLDIYFTAYVNYASGAKRTYHIPRIASMGYVERYQKERWRKLMENAFSDYSSAVATRLGKSELFYIARFAAIKAKSDPSDPPVEVEIAKTWRVTAHMGEPPSKFQTMVFYRTPMSAKDLQ